MLKTFCVLVGVFGLHYLMLVVTNTYSKRVIIRCLQ